MVWSTACSLTVVISNLLIYPGGLQGLHEGGETSLRIRLRAKKHFFNSQTREKGRVEVGEGAEVVIFDHVGWEERVGAVSDMWRGLISRSGRSITYLYK
jgi:hypothetical protein